MLEARTANEMTCERSEERLERELALPAQVFECALQLFCQVLKHGSCESFADELLG